ncbi:V-type ATPase subunit [Patescibacteria group bacterium]|nr:V-type ATPase subunit [Patescibacteria group bacterium]
MQDSADYILATGRVRVREKELINADSLTRMIDAKDPAEALKVLSEFDYADELNKESEVSAYEKILTRDMLQTRNFVLEVAKDPDLLGWLFSEFDFHNLKCFCKEKYFEVDLSEYYSNLGNVDPEKMREAVQNETETLPESEKDLTKIIKDVLEDFSKENELTPEKVDSYLDQRYFALLLKIAKRIKSEFVLDATRKKIDLANAKILVRAKNLNKDFAFVSTRLIKNGSVRADLYASYFEAESNDDFLAEVAKLFISARVEEVIKEAIESKDFFKVEKAFELYEAELSREGKKEAFGMEVLIAYVLAKMIANRNIRKIMSGKINEVSSEEIKERIIELV